MKFPSDECFIPALNRGRATLNGRGASGHSRNPLRGRNSDVHSGVLQDHRSPIPRANLAITVLLVIKLITVELPADECFIPAPNRERVTPTGGGSSLSGNTFGGRITHEYEIQLLMQSFP